MTTPMEQWGWQALPFRRDASADALFDAAGHKEALARLAYVLEHRALGLLTGEVGSGKTTLIRRLMAVIDEAQDMTEEMLQELRYVRNQHMDATSPFPLILVGQPEMRRHLRLKKYKAISQRIDMAYHLRA